MKQISTLDLHYLIKELDKFKGLRVDKVYNKDNIEIIINFYLKGSDKRSIKIINSRFLLVSSQKGPYSQPSGFCMLLRKKLEGKFLVSISQIEPERIVLMLFESKEEKYRLYLELFGKGNVILCNDQNVIIDSLIHHKFKDRTVKPKEKYTYPQMKYNLFNLKKNDLMMLFTNSVKDKVVTSLATELGLGGIYSEEICTNSGVSKDTNPKDLGSQEIDSIEKSLKKLVSRKMKPRLIFQNNKIIDAVPIELEFYKKNMVKEDNFFYEALEKFFIENPEIKKRPGFETKIDELKRVIQEQKISIKQLQKKEIDMRSKGEEIYKKYSLVSEVLSQINDAKEKYSWDEMKRKLKGNKTVKDLDIKDKKVLVETG
jgi:predicted ribosome quality control (RQC) complex YloA/Tae2 family protein